MGYGMEYVCPNCGYDVSYFLGFGKLYLDFKMTCEILSDLDNLINKEDLDKILSSESFIHESDKDNYENPEYLFEHVLSVDLYECSDCENIILLISLEFALRMVKFLFQGILVKNVAKNFILKKMMCSSVRNVVKLWILLVKFFGINK